MSISAKLQNLLTAANGTTGESDTTLTEGMQHLIDGYGQGGGAVKAVSAGVNFIDCDGTLITSWESADVADKDALPANPSHTGLVAQGWNWTLAEIKSRIQTYPGALIWVGQIYKTASGLTELDIVVTKRTGKTIPCNMVGNKDWGDGTEPDALTTHTYADYGTYTITCDGTALPGGSTSAGGGMFGSAYQSNNCYLCTAARIGENVASIGPYSFYRCYSITCVTIPNGISTFGIGVFYLCCSLKSISFPANTATMLASIIREDYGLLSVSLPESMASIDNNAVSATYYATTFTVPRNVSNIADYAFNNCYGIRIYDFTCVSSVPTLAATRAFQNINALCKIIVPDALYDDWIITTNWTAFANCTFKASEVEAW